MTNSAHDKRWTRIKDGNIEQAADKLAHRFEPNCYVTLIKEQIEGLEREESYHVKLHGSHGYMVLSKKGDKLIGSYR